MIETSYDREPKPASRPQQQSKKKKTLSDQDLEALVGDRLYSATETWELLDLVVTSASKVKMAS
jgi:hypothetical protein